MVLVAGGRRSLATQLMRRAMDELASATLIPVLDATPMAAPSIAGSASRIPWAFIA
jgi:hypothetical protein